jgi:hypothetical protein
MERFPERTSSLFSILISTGRAYEGRKTEKVEPFPILE